MGDQTDCERKSNLQLAYVRAGESYEAITEFRAKLLTLLPLATGIGAFLLLERAQKELERAQKGADGSQFWHLLGAIGIFSVVVTLGLFFYELRGMQRCHRLEVQASVLEHDLNLSRDQGPFRGQPPRALGNMLGPPAAGLMIYLATVFAWLWLAGYGFGWWKWSYPSGFGFLVGYVVVLIGAWVGLSRWLERSATGGLPDKWKKYKVEMPPMELELTDELADASKKAKEAAGKPELTDELDKAEKEYLGSVSTTLLKNRIPVTARNRQQGKRCLTRTRH